MRNKFKHLVLIALVLTACDNGGSGSQDPKKRLNEYISRSFSVKGADDRKELMEYLTGDAKTRLANWSDEQFRQAFVDNKREFVKLAFKEYRPMGEKEVNVTYELTYLDQSKGGGAKITNKKLCNMVLENGKWLISDVHNIKELVEYKNEMSLP